MCERSDLPVFRTTIEIQSGPGVFDKSGLVMTLTNLGVTRILCTFRLVLEGEAGKEISESSRLSSMRSFQQTNFSLSDAEYKTSAGLSNRRGIAYFLLLNTRLAIRQKSREPSFWEVINSYFLSINKKTEKHPESYTILKTLFT